MGRIGDKATIDRLQALLDHVRGCFDAAVAEGLYTVLAESGDPRLKDLVERRLLHAYPQESEAPASRAHVRQRGG